MGIKILWSDTALARLEEIFEYHKTKANPVIARDLIKGIVQKVMLLQSNPLIGSKEPMLSGRLYEYRYLVEKNYKIIYRYSDNLIRINTIFDCRQNPGKIVAMKD